MSYTITKSFSRNQVKNILEKYIKNTETEYNIVISTRFDDHDFPKNLKLTGIQKTKYILIQRIDQDILYCKLYCWTNVT